LEQTDDGLDGTGYMGDDLDELLDDLGRIPGGEDVDDPGAETSRAEELQEEWGTERGQLWQIGRHRLLCGDSTDEADVERLLDGAEPNLMVTDPPYGMDAVSSSGVLKERYDDVRGDQDTQVARQAVAISNQLPTTDEVWWGANYYADEMPPSSQWLVWDKKNGASDQMDAELAWTSLDGVTRRFEMASERGDNRHHPTQKPVELAQWCMRLCGGGDVLDLFAGAGWTIIAAENEGRACYACEIDPGYCAVTLDRCSEAGMECELISQ
jgi:DNA modification methylase